MLIRHTGMGNRGRTLVSVAEAEAAPDGYSEPMPTNARVAIPSIAHHVRQRGNNRQEELEDAEEAAKSW